MRIAICDDERALLDLAAQVVRRFCLSQEIPCEIAAFESAKALLFEAQGSYPFDLMLLDIDMPHMDGMALARAIRQADDRVPIAFLTQHAHFVFEGYEVGAMRYVLKRDMETKLPDLLRDIAQKAAAQKEYLLLIHQGEQIRLDLDRVLCFEAQGHDTLAHMSCEALRMHMPLSRVAMQLSVRFAPAHRSYIVNLAHVERLSRTECLLSGGKVVPVSRAAHAPLVRAYLALYGKDAIG